MELIRCPRCAKEVPANSQFCRRCGYTIAWNIATAPSPQVAPKAKPLAKPVAAIPPRAAHRPTPPTPSKPRKGGIFGVLAILGAIIFFSNITRRSNFVPPPSPHYNFPSYTPSFKTTPTYSPPTYYPPRSNTTTIMPPYVPHTIVIPGPPPPAPYPYYPNRNR